MSPKKITKKRLLLGLIAGFITFVVLYILLPPIELKIEFYNTDDLEQAKNKLSSLVEWSETNASKELDFAKNLSKENYNQQRVTKEIIKNLKDIKTIIENIKILFPFVTHNKEYNELVFKAMHISINIDSEIILHLLYNERNITHQKSYFLFDKERLEALEDFLTFTSDRLKEDFLQKDMSNLNVEILAYVGMLIGYIGGNSFLYLGDISKNFTCEFNNPKTQKILNNIGNLDELTHKAIKILNEKYIDSENEKEYFNKTFNMISKQNKEIFNEFKDINLS